MNLVTCACGCGELRQAIGSDGRHRRFIYGHYMKISRGEKNPHWRGGKYLDDRGYIRFSSTRHGKREHVVVMEDYLGRPLEENEVVHHKNGNRSDNRIENLELMASNGLHLSTYHSGHRTCQNNGQICQRCGSIYVKRRGIRKGKQYYRCTECKKSFN